MKRPFVGIGHSMGGNHLTNLALMHPRFFESLILVDPVIARSVARHGSITPAALSAVRRDRWPSKKAALQSFKKNKFYQVWDPRVLDLWVEYGLRELPTKLYPTVPPAVEPYNPEAVDVTLTTTKHQEVFTFLRAQHNSLRASLDGFTEEEKKELKKLTHPDLDSTWDASAEIYRPEPIITFDNLPFLRPSVLYLFGKESALSAEPSRKEKMAATGTGLGGSGGAKAGRVKEIVMKDTGHLIPMEKVTETAEHCATWIASELARFKRNEELLDRFRGAQAEQERYTLSSKLMDRFKVSLEQASGKKSKI
jgi:pimeloyl-ACP methyl ester carboxylesterase